MSGYSRSETRGLQVAQFESPLALWIVIWQRQLIYGAAPILPS